MTVKTDEKNDDVDDVAPDEIVRQAPIPARRVERARSRVDAPELIPARMLNEFAYCPRLSYLEWVDADFADNADTVDGRYKHRRVDKEAGDVTLPSEGDNELLKARSVSMSAPEIGLIARIDVLEGEGKTATPIDYKRGTPPDNQERSWEPERVQVCAQALILEENGFICEKGVLYFVESKQRVDVPLTPELRARTKELIAEMRAMADAGTAPPPLKDSPKCVRCSLVGICLPDEINALRLPERAEAELSRRLVPPRDDALPVYVQAYGAYVGKSGEELTISVKDSPATTARLVHTSQLSVFGSAQVSTPALQTLLGREIPICYFSSGGWFYGITTGIPHKNVELRRAQYAAAEKAGVALAIAKRLVWAKIKNCRTLLRRNGVEAAKPALRQLQFSLQDLAKADSEASLLGHEGNAARIYFQSFTTMLKQQGQGDALHFNFDGRNRRPPRDPINAMLSLLYALLCKDWTIILHSVGLDPYLGFYHRPRYGRPSLALDLMEEFRPLIADSVVLSVVNTGEVRPDDFIARAGAVTLSEAARKRVIKAYERRMDELVTHPVFGYRLSYRRTLDVQARLFGRYLLGEIDEYPAFCTR